jgi:hypothetical protein
MSYRATRYLGQHGFSVALAMAASDFVHRLLAGQPIAEIIDEMASRQNAEDLAFNTTSFMASDAMVALAKGWLKALTGRKHGCEGALEKLLTMTANFVGAEAINRTIGEALRDHGVLTRTDAQQMAKVSQAHFGEINDRMEQFDKFMDAGEEENAFMTYFGVDAERAKAMVQAVKDPSTPLPECQLPPSLDRLHGVVREKSYLGAAARFTYDLIQLQRRIHDKAALQMIEDEIAYMRKESVAHCKRLFHQNVEGNP